MRDGSSYYVLAEKAGTAQTENPEQPSNPKNLSTPGNSSTLQPSNLADSPKTGNNSTIWLWMILVSTSGGTAIVLFVCGKRRKGQNNT